MTVEALRDASVAPAAATLRRYGLMMGGMIAGIFGLALPLVRSSGIPGWPFWVAGAFILAALVRPLSLRRVYDGWLRFGQAMGHINGMIILTVLFYGVVMPIGLVMRWRGHDPLSLGFDGSLSTYKHFFGPADRPSSMERPF